MAYFSPFWMKHYKDVGFCCTYQPLQANYMYDVNGAGERIERKLIEFIDTDWMDSKKLKWISHDKQGYIAWIGPDGTIYRLQDLQRNEEGIRYEKDFSKLKINGDGNEMMGQASMEQDLYEWELAVLKRCGFCAGGGGGGMQEPGEKESEDGVTNNNGGLSVAPAWQGFAAGTIPDYEGMYGPVKNMVTDTSETIFSGHVTEKATVDYGKIYGRDNTGIDERGSNATNPYAGTALPQTGGPTGRPMPVPDKAKNPVTRTKHVTTSVVPKRAEPYKWDGYGGKATPPPPSVGTYLPPGTYDPGFRKRPKPPMPPKPKTLLKQPKPGFVNRSNDIYWVKPEHDYDKDGNEVDQKDPDKDKKVVFWSSGAYEVPPGGIFQLPIDGYTKQGSGNVRKVDDFNNKGIWIDKYGQVQGVGINIFGGPKWLHEGWEQMFDRANQKK